MRKEKTDKGKVVRKAVSTKAEDRKLRMVSKPLIEQKKKPLEFDHQTLWILSLFTIFISYTMFLDCLVIASKDS